MGHVPGTSIWWPIAPDHPGEQLPGIAVLAFQAPLTFLNAELFERDMLAAISRPGVKLVVFEAAGVVDIDFTAAQSLKAVVEAARRNGVAFAIARLESVGAERALDRFGLRPIIGPDHIFRSVAEAIATLRPGDEPAPAT
jgi:MFS superfamily sulfate permease-like transporter